jgi:hypothetical protein
MDEKKTKIFEVVNAVLTIWRVFKGIFKKKSK